MKTKEEVTEEPIYKYAYGKFIKIGTIKKEEIKPKKK
jgi:hypothetical protein